MSHIRLGFSTKKDDWLSRLICWATSWRHSHVVLVSPDGRMIVESTSFPFPDPQTGEWRTGCRMVPVAYLMNRDVVELREVAHPDPLAVWEHAVKMATEKIEYDHEFIRDWIFRRPKNGNSKKVTCHELIEVCAERAGHRLYAAALRHTSPRDLYLISKEL